VCRPAPSPATASRTGSTLWSRSRRFDKIGPHIVVILDDQYGFATLALYQSVRLLRLTEGKVALPSRQVNPDGRALARLAVDFNVTAGLLDEAVHLLRPQPRRILIRGAGRAAAPNLLRAVQALAQAFGRTHKVQGGQSRRAMH
jgi:hypothetical protein